MKSEHDDMQFIQGFNNGYMLSIYGPKLLERLSTLPHTPAYKEGLEKGAATYEQHKSVSLNAKAKIWKRKAKLAKLKIKKKGKDKNDLER